MTASSIFRTLSGMRSSGGESTGAVSEMPPNDSWVAIDFETASIRGTPCAVAMVAVEDGVPTRRDRWLIRPPLFEFNPFNVALHGITPEMCRDAPGWAESLARIEEFRAGRPLVAHYAAYDIGVIRDACALAGVPWPTLAYACTVVLGRRLWPGLSSYSLPFLAARLGLAFEDHHDPLADAEAAATIGILATATAGVGGLMETVASVDALMGSLSAEAWSGCHLRPTGSGLVVPTSPSPGLHPDERSPIFGRTVSFTGELSIPRREAMQAVVDRGAVASRGVTRKTDLLVTGYQDLTKLAAGQSKSAKLRRAEELRTEGREVEIITERDLVVLLQAADAASEAGPDRSVAGAPVA